MSRGPTLRWQAGCLQIVRRPLPRWIVSTPVRRERGLLLLHQRQHRAQPFVLHDRTGSHGPDLVEHPERQRRPGLSRDWGDRGRSGMIARIVVGRGIVVWGGFCRGPPLRAGFQLVPVINEAV